MKLAKSELDSVVTLKSAVPYMRFLRYEEVGMDLAPHVDASKWDVRNENRGRRGSRSSHTFILFLRDCERGGSTVLLNADETRIQAISPKRGRLFVFPHRCLHKSDPTIDVPKLLLRGEMF